METRKRSIAKAISWRVIASVITATVAYAVTGKLELALLVGGLDTAVKLGAFYFHERTWNRIGYGRSKRPEFEI